MKILTENQVKTVINSFRRVFQASEILELKKPAFDFLITCSGFTEERYYGNFLKKYANVLDLAREILQNQSRNSTKDILPSDENYELFVQRENIYNKIVEFVKTYKY